MPTDFIEQKDKKNKDSWSFKEFFGFLIVVLVIVVPVRMFIAQPFVVSGESMHPTFENGEYLIVDELSYEIGHPSRGDVVIFKYPDDEKKFFIKRIIGLPGETVEILGNKIFIIKNGGEKIELNEPYKGSERIDFSSTNLGEKEYYVMGDNRSKSYDSRMIGPIQEHYIIGRAFLRLLPFEKMDYLPGKYNY